MACVYVLSNTAFAQLRKIGFTGGCPHNRAADVSRGTGVPTPFVVSYSIEILTIEAAREVEQAVHATLSAKRVNNRREFFSVTEAEAIDAIERIAYQKGVVSLPDPTKLQHIIDAQNRAAAIASEKRILAEEHQRRTAEESRARVLREEAKERNNQARINAREKKQSQEMAVGALVALGTAVLFQSPMPLGAFLVWWLWLRES